MGHPGPAGASMHPLRLQGLAALSSPRTRLPGATAAPGGAGPRRNLRAVTRPVSGPGGSPRPGRCPRAHGLAGCHCQCHCWRACRWLRERRAIYTRPGESRSLETPPQWGPLVSFDHGIKPAHAADSTSESHPACPEVPTNRGHRALAPVASESNKGRRRCGRVQ